MLRLGYLKISTGSDMASAVDVNDFYIVAGCDNAIVGVWDAIDAAEVNMLTGEYFVFEEEQTAQNYSTT